MTRKLRTKQGRAEYRQLKVIAEPVFGQIKEASGFRRFHLRGRVTVTAEWHLECAVHNLAKLFRSGRAGRVVGSAWAAGPAIQALGARGRPWLARSGFRSRPRPSQSTRFGLQPTGLPSWRRLPTHAPRHSDVMVKAESALAEGGSSHGGRDELG